MRRRSRALVVAASAAAMFAVGTTQANAGMDGTGYTKNSCGAADFASYGDIWYIFDLCKDGRGVWVDIDMQKNGVWTNHETIYYNKGYTGYTPAKYNRDYTEHVYIRFRVGLGNNSAYISGTYGPWTYVYA